MESDWKWQWESMTVDELFALREQIQEVLSNKLQQRSEPFGRNGPSPWGWAGAVSLTSRCAFPGVALPINAYLPSVPGAPN